MGDHSSSKPYLKSKKEIEGEEIFPIQVHSEVYYFYYSVCYFYL